MTERRAEELDGIFEACEAVIVEEIAGETHDEDVARTLIEQKFGRDAAIGATEDRDDRILRRRALGTVMGEVPLIRRVGRVAGIPFHQPVERFGWGDDILGRHDRVRPGFRPSDGERARGNKGRRTRHELAPRRSLKRSPAMFAVIAHGRFLLRRKPRPAVKAASRPRISLG
jgi:hypothetical protein